MRLQKCSHKVVTVNTAEPYVNQKGETEHYPVGDGDHSLLPL